MESAFAALSDATRRAILGQLVAGARTVGELEAALKLPQPSVSKHLRVLREAGFVEATVDAQRRVYRLRPGPLQQLDAWMLPFRRHWEAQVDALEKHLDNQAEAPARAGRPRRKPR